MTAAQVQEVVGAALLRVADNVAKHIIQQGEWAPDDTCFKVDLRTAEEELMQAYSALLAENERLRTALVPFAIEMSADRLDSVPQHVVCTVGDCRAAARAREGQS